jgi:hypothetical protein
VRHAAVTAYCEPSPEFVCRVPATCRRPRKT